MTLWFEFPPPIPQMVEVLSSGRGRPTWPDNWGAGGRGRMLNKSKKPYKRKNGVELLGKRWTYPTDVTDETLAGQKNKEELGEGERRNER